MPKLAPTVENHSDHRVDGGAHLLDIAEKLNEVGAGLRSLAEPWADTTSPAGRMVLPVFAGIAEFERVLIHQRASSGRSAARARGVRFGRPSKLSPKQIALGQRLIGEGTSVREAAKLLKCHHATLYRSHDSDVVRQAFRLPLSL